MKSETMQKWRGNAHFFGANAAYMESLYESWLQAPQSVPAPWDRFFHGLPRVNGAEEASHAGLRQGIALQARQRGAGGDADADQVADHDRRQMRVTNLINAYRTRGHRQARLDPLGLQTPNRSRALGLQAHDLEEADLDAWFSAETLFTGQRRAPLRDIIEMLEAAYCSTIGVELMHIDDADERSWLLRRVESSPGLARRTAEEQRHLLEQLTAAEGLERYLATSYPGAKRFGLEGGESLIPLLDELVQSAGAAGIVEVVIGMAHRGRLNVLVNIFGKNPAELIQEFAGNNNQQQSSASGDVKYHQGFSSNVLTPGGEIHLALAFNPSHLEIVAPVVSGSVRARQDRRRDFHRLKVLPVVLHGDAAFAAQGVVMETFQMSGTRAHHIGGTVHIVINNQIGFTTANPLDARSTQYCSDIAHAVRAPVLHVNADDPEAVVGVTRLALEYRQHFHKDVVIDLVCYRRHGHNEADDPRVTQPLMYRRIREHPTVRSLYTHRLQSLGVVDSRECAAMESEYRDALEQGQHVVKSLVREPDTALFVDWSPHLDRSWHEACDTRVPAAKLHSWGARLGSVPEGFSLHPGLKKLLAARRGMSDGELPVDWGCAENLAYASLLDAGISVRLSGQDSVRGTFAHRHLAFYDQKTGAEHVPLHEIARERDVLFTARDSLLSELAALGFEYGYATTAPDVLTIWEAQFGDFANGAQIIIDQFLSSGEFKWGRLCGLTLLLPHGYEGQGPEHSSARLERFLQLCAQENMQVCVPTTPAQIFHLLRRQVLRPLRRPLVAMTPKSLLRHPDAVSRLEELGEGCFYPVMRSGVGVEPKRVRRLVLCSGKVYYDLVSGLAGREDLDVLRLEQLYPFPVEELGWELLQYENVAEMIWCQEEPRNQGAWYTTRHRISNVLNAVGIRAPLQYAGRDSSASAAAGYPDLHKRQQAALVAEALGDTAS